MNLYHYHSETREYLGLSEARIDPLETVKAGHEVYLIPANTTTEEPPLVGSDQVAIMVGDGWTIEENHRGKTVYDKTTAQALTITEIGKIPDEVTQLVPCEYPKWDGAQWAEDENKRPTYADLRRAEYPPAADYLDGIVKGDQAQVDKYIADCLAVKAKYPKE
jgi:hypothetical protein